MATTRRTAMATSPTRLKNPQAIQHLKDKVLLPAFSYADVLAYEHAIAFSVAKMMNADMLADTQHALVQALENGTPFSEFKKQLKLYLMAKGWWGEQMVIDPKDGQSKKVQLGSNRRLKIIYETNLSAAYAQGRWQKIQSNKRLLPYLQYMPSISKARRDEHKPYYGLVRPVDDPIWQLIYPPNGFGCKCWTKSLSKNEAQALLEKQAKQGTRFDLPIITHHNHRRGVDIKTVQGTQESFAGNGDRLSALLKVAGQKHGDSFSQTIKQQLSEFMLDLVASPNFNQFVPTVIGDEFTTRFNELKSLIKDTGGNRENSMAIRKQFAKGDNYVVATISPEIKERLGSQTNIIWLSDDTIIKMLSHHPELDLLPLFRDTHLILKNAELIVKENDLNITYFRVGKQVYQATIKVTQDKKELYLLTVFKSSEKDLNKALKKKKILIDNRV